MALETKTVSIYLTLDRYNDVKKCAEKQNRSINNFLLNYIDFEDIRKKLDDKIYIG